LYQHKHYIVFFYMINYATIEKNAMTCITGLAYTKPIIFKYLSMIHNLIG